MGKTVKITLDGGAGELDSAILCVDLEDPLAGELIQAGLQQFVEGIGSFDVGDTITIREVA